MWRDWSLTLKNLILPTFCKLCGERLLTEENGFFCPTCWESSPRIERPYCSRCGKPHEAMAGLGSKTNFPCAACREKPNRYVRRVFGAAYYGTAVGMAIKLFKFQDKRRLAGPLGELMRDFAAQEMDTGAYDVIVPVPLHKVRARDRGFNQSRLLALEIGALFPNAEFSEALLRIRPTRVQSKLEGKARRANVRGAFAVADDAFKGKTVLLVDDVVTTAGTVSECAAALRRAGAAHVDVLAAALGAPAPDWEARLQ